MEQLLSYRDQLISRLERSVDEFCEACLRAGDVHRHGDGWNIHQTVVHLRDAHRLVYGLRARRTAEQDNPLFEDFDQDAWMAAHYDPGEPLDQALAELKKNVLDLAKWLRHQPPETWARESRHEVMGGGFTLQTWVERGLAHIEGHLEEVREGKRKT
jgi:hypothetical protein